MIKPWIQIGSRPVGDFRIFSLRSDLKRSPRTGEQHDFFVLESVDWVNIIALTPERQLVMVEQYRHGSNTIELEIPGGMMDAGDDSPVVTGARELREETGYEGRAGSVIGEVYANPAILNNRCHTVLFQDCRRRYPTVFDQSEDIVTRLVDVAEVPGLVASGRIKHSLVVVALFHYELLRQKEQR